MRVNFFLKTIWMIVLICNFQIASADRAVASSLNVNQSILPVKFVYLSGHGYINDIWSNVGERDDLYVVKFFNEDKEEVPLTEGLFSQYTEEAEKVMVQRDITQSNQFLKGDKLTEEILTIV